MIIIGQFNQNNADVDKGKNRGNIQSYVVTYKQQGLGLRAYYDKRIVYSDVIHTKQLYWC